MLPRLIPLTSRLARPSTFATTATASRRLISLSSIFSPAATKMSSDLTLYTFGTPNGHKASITIEELGVKYEVKTVNIMTNEQKSDWYLAINPNGRIPALKDGEQRIFESGAIMLYLTDKYDPEHKISFPAGSGDYYEMMSWLMFQMGGLGPMQGQANHFRMMAKVRSEYGIERYIDETKRLLGVLESRLKDHPYLAGDKYSIADIANYSWARGAPYLDIDFSEFPALAKWIDVIEKRDAVQAGLKVPGGGRTKEQMKEMFDGMKKKIDAMGNTDQS